jgi:hypothetical protein
MRPRYCNPLSQVPSTEMPQAMSEGHSTGTPQNPFGNTNKNIRFQLRPLLGKQPNPVSHQDPIAVHQNQQQH